MTKVWTDILPAFISKKLENRHNLQKIIGNTGWLFADKILRMGVGLLVGVWVARYLGPEQFGLFNYVVAFVALFATVATMGLDGIVVRDILREPAKVNTTLGTAFVLQCIGSLVAVVITFATIAWLRPNDSLVKAMVVILGFSLMFKPTEVVKYWFESQVESRYTVWVENAVFVIMAAVRVAMILLQAPLIAFIWVALGEAVLVAVGLLVIYAKQGGQISVWQPGIMRAKSLLMDSWALILSSVAIIIYMRIDQIMLGEMLGGEAVGIYSAAVRISEVWYFIPIVITASVFPAIIDAKKQSEKLYTERLQMLYDLMTMMSLSAAIFISFLADPIIRLLYGHAYHQSGVVLTIHIWAGVFVCLGVARGKWLLVENLNIYSFFYTGLGAIINIIGNYLAIPKYGVNGAAFATIVSYGISVIVAPALFAQTRKSSIQLLNSFNVLRIYCNVKKNV